jgi:PAS domain S-box-containing protein
MAKRFRRILECTGGMLALNQPGERPVFFGDVVGLVGYTPDEYAALSQEDRVHADDVERVMAALAAHQDTPGAGFTIEYRARKKGGGWIWLESVGTNLLDDPDVRAFVVRSRDVTARKDAAENARETQLALERSEQRFRRMVDGGWDVITLTGADQRYKYVSGSVQRALGYTAAEMLTMRMIDLLHPDDVQPALAARNRAMATPGGGGIFEARLRHRDGHWVWMEISGVNLVDDPAVGGLVANSREITERKRAEDALTRLNADLEQRVAERTAELARAAAAKDDFLASMSHELRTPLTGILATTEVIEAGVYGPTTPELRSAIGRVEESSRHLLALINDILDVAKVEAGKVELELGAVDVSELCRASLRLVHEPARAKRIQLSSAGPADPPIFLADERRLKQVLVNLLVNAVKFTPEGGQVGVEVDTDDRDRTLRIVVWDTGVGIAADDVPRLFRPFVQLDNRIDRSHSGTGLGLVLVRRLTELHGGTVSVTSGLGKGSRFTLTFPMRALPERRAATAKAAGEAPTAALPSGLRVLLAEDDATNVVALRDLLVARGHEVRLAHDGREAIDMAHEMRPDVVLMDIQMPQVDGLTAMRELRGAEATRLLPIIAVTALAMPGDRERCIAAGATDYVTKPVRIKELARRLEALAANARGA